MSQVFPPLWLLELERLAALESSDSCSAYSFPSLSLVEFCPTLGNVIFNQNSRSPCVDLWSTCPRSPLRVHFLRFSTRNVPASLASSNWTLSPHDHCALLGIPFLLCGPESASRQKSRVIIGVTSFVLLLSRFIVLCAYCCLKQYENSVFPVFYPVF